MAAPVYALFIEGLKDLRDLGNLPDKIVKRASMALNDTAKYARKETAGRIERSVAFPKGYVPDRLRITQFASPSADKLSVRISAQRRPTSLARFAKPPLNTGRQQAGVRVEIKPGRSFRLKTAFLMKLRQGNNGISETQHNLGLAIRLPPGKKPGKAWKPKEIRPGLWLLYGPSVDQAFISVRKQGAGVASDLSGDIADHLQAEFLRLMDLDL